MRGSHARPQKLTPRFGDGFFNIRQERQDYDAKTSSSDPRPGYLFTIHGRNNGLQYHQQADRFSQRGLEIPLSAIDFTAVVDPFDRLPNGRQNLEGIIRPDIKTNQLCLLKRFL